MLKFFSFSSSSTEKPQSVQQGEASNHNADDDVVIHSCSCCGTCVKFPEYIKKYKCGVCQTTISLVDKRTISREEKICLEEFKQLVKKCKLTTEKGLHTAHKDLEYYITKNFSSSDILNNSFILDLHIGDYSIDYTELHILFRVLIELPTKRPYYKLLLTVNDLLRRPPTPFGEVQQIRWLLILLEIPTLAGCLYHERRPESDSTLYTPEVKSLSYEILKRTIGFIAHSGTHSLENLAKWLSHESINRFDSKVQLINLYITFHLTRVINRKCPQTSNVRDTASSNARNTTSSPTYAEFNESEKLNATSLRIESADTSLPSTTGQISRNGSGLFSLPRNIQNGFRNWSDYNLNSMNAKKDSKTLDFKLKIQDYGNEWHIKSAARLLSVFFVANGSKLPIYSFYNTLVDFIHVKQDFESWQYSFCQINNDDPNQILYKIIKSGGVTMNSNNNGTNMMMFCQYPFLLSLGAKISILEYEARKYMEQKAEEAFIKAIDSRKIMDVHVRFLIRRDYITNDSLRCIKNNKNDLKKSLKIEFIGEPGIDAGGLKKEWFQLLTKSLFKEEHGMFFYSEESQLCWFAPLPLETNDELYYLVGVVLGLAIYNSVILDLRFPLALYKRLSNKKVTLDDYVELFPTTGRSLVELLHLKEDVSKLCIYFDSTFKDSYGKLVVKELVPGGSEKLVTNENRRLYVNEWIDFHMNKVIKKQFTKFYDGFQSVIGGNAFSLFAPKEIEMMICGNNEVTIDVQSLKAVTRYTGWLDESQAKSSNLTKWFWEWFEDLNYKQQKKFLWFVTGSDRIPATGFSTMSLKITRLQTISDVKRLPVAHTCFNELCIYEYYSKNEMIKKLNLSVTETEGFGLR